MVSIDLNLRPHGVDNSSVTHSRRPQSQVCPTSAFIVNALGIQTCAFCWESHFTTDCSKVTGMDAHKKVVLSGGQLSKETKDCPSLSRCRNCRGKCHTSICEKKNHSRENPKSIALLTSTQKLSSMNRLLTTTFTV